LRRQVCVLTAVGILAVSVAVELSAAPVSRVWPLSDDPAAYMIENMPNLETIGYPVDPDTTEIPEELYAVVEAPAYIELLSNVYVYSREMPGPEVEDITREGQAYRRYTFAPPRKDQRQWARFYTHWIPRPTETDRKSPGVFAWHFETPDGPEMEQSRPIELLPELPEASPPKRMIINLYGSYSNLCIDADKLPAVLPLVQRGGVNVVSYWQSTAKALKAAGCHEMGIKIQVGQLGISGYPDFAPAGPEQYTVDKDDNVLKSQDPQYVIDRDGEPWSRSLATCRRLASRVDIMAQDIEWAAIWDTGFSEAAIKAFAEQNGLDPAGLTPQIIWRDYRRQWGDFRAEQQLTLASYFTKAAREANPDCLTLWAPGAPYTSTDPDLMSDMIEWHQDNQGRMVYLIFPFPTDRMQEGFDILQPMWYNHGVSQVRQGFEWSRAITPRVNLSFVPVLLGQGREFYYPGGDPGNALRAIVWAVMLGGADGYGYWLSEFSPLQWSWIARTNREISKLEDILLDGQPDAPDVIVKPMPKKRFTLVSGQKKQVFPVPDFEQTAVCRSFADGPRRLIGVVNVDLGMDVYFRLTVNNLPQGRYRVLDVAENKILCPNLNHTTFTAKALRRGLLMRTPAKYGVTLLLVAPADEIAPEESDKLLLNKIEAAYADYKEPDTTGSVLAERGGLTIRYDMVGADAAPAILIESPGQQVWIRPQTGGRITDWRIKDGDRSVMMWTGPQYGGAAMDLFWMPSDTRWSGEERGEYELVYAKIHGGKAYVQLRQTKSTPSLHGMVLTKTIAVPLRHTDIEVKVAIENPGTTEEVGFSYWAHNEFRPGSEELAASAEEAYPQVYMQTDEGVEQGPLKSLVWVKPDKPHIPGGSIEWDRAFPNGVTTADWIAQWNPLTGEAMLCQIDEPSVAQFYSWRSADKHDLSVEWMYPQVTLKAGEAWSTRYWLRYLKSVKPEDLPRNLYPEVP